jgi:hypothetical protein
MDGIFTRAYEPHRLDHLGPLHSSRKRLQNTAKAYVAVVSEVGPSSAR